MKLFGATDTFDTQILFTPWSIVHFAAGFAAFPVLEQMDIKMDRLALWAIVHGIFELKDTAGAYFPGTCKWIMACNKSFAGSIGDEVSAIVGYLVSQSMGVKSLWSALFLITMSFLIVGSPLVTKPK